MIYKQINIQIIVEQLFLIITQRNQEISKNGIRLPYMQILSNENIFAKIIIKKSIEENNQKIIFNNALICQQLCFKLNDNLNLNNINQADEDLKTKVEKLKDFVKTNYQNKGKDEKVVGKVV